jgi:hypothetical protein
MSTRSRILWFGSAGLVVLAGGLCAALVHGLIGQLLTFVLISVGLGGAVLLLFLEVGLSEDRDRARDEQSRRARPGPRTTARMRSPRRPRRPG